MYFSLWLCPAVSCLNSGSLFRSFDFMVLIIFLQVHSRMKPKEPKIVFLSVQSQWSNPRQSITTSPAFSRILSLSLPFSFLGAFLEPYNLLKERLNNIGMNSGFEEGSKSPIFAKITPVLYPSWYCRSVCAFRYPCWAYLSDIGF